MRHSRLGLGEQMRPDDADQFAGADDFGFLPELWKVALIAGDQVVRAGGVGALDRKSTRLNSSHT